MTKSLSREVSKSKILATAWISVQKNGRLSKSDETREEIRVFNSRAATNLERLQRQLRKKTFVFPPSVGVKALKKGKKSFRPLVIAKIESRIVQRAVHDVLVKVPAIKAYVHTPFSFGGVPKLGDGLASVPAAIQCVLTAIGSGAKYMKRSDISQFFTKISKPTVTLMVKKAVNDDDFLELFKQAISVELENMAELKKSAQAFPIWDIGVAQGNSLSPLLGNMILFDFDQKINSLPGITSIRFIDDFIILGPNKRAVDHAFAFAEQALLTLGMGLAVDKTQYGSTQQNFEFLGIQFSNGLLRPTPEVQNRFLKSIQLVLEDATRALFQFENTGEIEKKKSLVHTLRLIDGKMQGWGVHYRFCNDKNCFAHLDKKVRERLTAYIGTYSAVRSRTDEAGAWRVIGIQSLSQIPLTSFIWPKLSP